MRYRYNQDLTIAFSLCCNVCDLLALPYTLTKNNISDIKRERLRKTGHPFARGGEMLTIQDLNSATNASYQYNGTLIFLDP